jgi:hypothetical protein
VSAPVQITEPTDASQTKFLSRSGRQFLREGVLMTPNQSIFGLTKSYFGMVAVEWLALVGFVILFCADVILALHHLL